MKNKYYSNSKDYINRWIISYADFVTMLLALFMVLFVLVQSDELNNFENSLKSKFSLRNTPQTNKDINILEEKRKLLKIFATTEIKAINNGYSGLDEVEKKVKDALNTEKNVIIEKDDKEIIIRLNDAVLFSQ
ncbi:MAG: flagellar motor protein MotB [Candidatus Gastranaerophilales bacterium]|nr:flagellar motor protein MotB [Candidatus Gastranaerophilales bacterium]